MKSFFGPLRVGIEIQRDVDKVWDTGHGQFVPHNLGVVLLVLYSRFCWLGQET